MQTIPANGYPVLFGEKEYETLNAFIEKSNYSSIFILVDTHSNELCLLRFLSFLATDKTIEIIEIESGEAEKNINSCVEIWNILTELGADRKTVLVNIGGGVITDIGGFVASTFKRGIDFINIPTTLLAMVDASIGGKNGVDLGNLKNQIGVINVPKTVLIDTEFLSTLPQNEMRSGLAEMLKHGLIFDADYWSQFKDLSQTDFADFDALIHRSIEIKNEIVMQDPTENGIRKALNFGHTLGHAIESYFLENKNKKTLLHGEAIAAGMILESFISWQKGMLTEAEYDDIKKTINAVFETIIFEENDLQPIFDLLIHDKKNEYGKIQFALLDGIGKIKIDQEVDNELIIKSFDDYKK
ncbi:3-dehydroquinate synthase [Flavobacterium sp. 102]|uniref:3-dehydroquinate synthase n=1 Tax=Flavobacterium sp. 102 TaxID=2135623 RepID=UPI000EB314D8|nr:3-dehydroquinate synthase [Flavobacterium sp. 102]RKS02387.1 3-dehydroquinate synthase [Flavobacterium sp. 102]